MLRIRTALSTAPALVALTLLAGCSAPAPPSVESPVQTRMFEHFRLARDMRVLVVAGDLEELRVAAQEMQEAEGTWGLPPGSDPYLDELRASAGSTEDAARDHRIEAAAQSVADLARVCGDCHVATESDLGSRFQLAEPLIDDPAVRHTNYLSWVSRLLWDGLVGPSERMWRAGADALADARGMPAPRATHVPEEELQRSGEILQGLGMQARTAVDPEERAQVLAEVWTSCAQCHREAGLR